MPRLRLRHEAKLRARALDFRRCVRRRRRFGLSRGGVVRRVLGEGHERDLLASPYWPLQEFIDANGELDEPIRWAAQRVRDTMPLFSTGERPLAFTGEAMFPWMFEQESALRPFKPAMDLADWRIRIFV